MALAEQTGEGDGDEPSSGSRSTHFDFQAKVFQAPGAHFILKLEDLGKKKVPMFAVDMGTGAALISLKHLRKTFGIQDGGHDDRLIETAAAGLEFVPDIRPGDAIPTEVLNGTASWTVRRKHKQIARERIQAQLLSWVTGKPVEAADPDALAKMMESAQTKAMLRKAFQQAAAALGLAADQAEQVIDRIETVARELCYIEALRDRFSYVLNIRGQLERLVKAYAGEQRVSAEIGRIKLLMADGVKELQAPLTKVDQRIVNVVQALQTIDDVIKTIRKARDDIHFILMQWDPVIDKWKDLEPTRGATTEKAIEALYQLLAGRFSTGKSIIRKKLGAKKPLPKVTFT